MPFLLNLNLLYYCQSPDLFTCSKGMLRLIYHNDKFSVNKQYLDKKLKMTARHVIFIGRVQGVGFRFTTHRMAHRHQLTGFVRNLPDGTVEMLAQGLAQDVDDCIRDIKDYYGDYLRDTRTQEIPTDPRYKDFRITF